MRKRLRPDKVRAIKLMAFEGIAYREIGEMFGVDENTVGNIAKGVSYPNVAPELTCRRYAVKGEGYIRPNHRGFIANLAGVVLGRNFPTREAAEKAVAKANAERLAAKSAP